MFSFLIFCTKMKFSFDFIFHDFLRWCHLCPLISPRGSEEGVLGSTGDRLLDFSDVESEFETRSQPWMSCMASLPTGYVIAPTSRRCVDSLAPVSL